MPKLTHAVRLLGNCLGFTYRLLYLSILIIGGIVLAYLLRLGMGIQWHYSPLGKRIIAQWMRMLADNLGLSISHEGMPSKSPCLLVANHISWLDIIAIANLVPANFVAKADVRQWPFIGSLASVSGTLFMQRKSVAALRNSIEDISRVLSNGKHVVIFPEGTTTDGKNVLPFHSGLFKSAITAQIPIQAIAIRYSRCAKLDRIAPFINDDNFFSHLMLLLWVHNTQVQLSFCDPIKPSLSGRSLAHTSRYQVLQALSIKAA